MANQHSKLKFMEKLSSEEKTQCQYLLSSRSSSMTNILKKLRIPSLFVSRYPSLVPKTVTFITAASSNRSWKVDIVEEDDKGLYFKNGWSTFVKDNDVEVTNFLVFKFVGDLTFEVKIYGKSACDKELENLPCINQYYCIQHHNNCITTLDRRVTRREIDPIDVRYVTVETVDRGHSNQEIEAPQKEDLMSLSRKLATGMRNLCLKNLMKAPIWTLRRIILSKFLCNKPIYAEKGVMCFPTEFFRKHMKNKRQEVEIETVEGVVYAVTLIIHMKRTRTFARLSKGWADFAKANRLKTGETLVFELTRKGYHPKFIVSRQ